MVETEVYDMLKYTILWNQMRRLVDPGTVERVMLSERDLALTLLGRFVRGDVVKTDLEG